MFNQEIVNRAIQYADSLLGSHCAIFPADNELGKVIEAIAFPMMNTRGVGLRGGDLETINKFLVSDGAHDDNGSLEKLSNDIAKTIKLNIKLAREVALPLVNTATISIDHQIEVLNDELRKTFSYDISENPIYELIVNNSSVNEIVKTAGNSTYDGYSDGLKILPPATLEQIVEMCKTGSNEFDELIADLFKYVGESRVCAIYTRTLSVNGVKTNIKLNDGERLVSFLMGYAIMSTINKDNIPEGVDMSLDKFTKRCLEYKGACRYYLKVFIDNYRYKESAGNVIYDITYTNNGCVKMNVIPSIYKQAMEQSIPNEAIIGSTMHATGSWNITSLIKYKDNYISAFEAERNKHLSVIKNKRVEIILNAIRKSLNIINDDSEVRLGRLDWSRIRQTIIAKVNTNDDISPADLIIDFVMQDMFSGTLVPTLVRRMNEYSKFAPDSRPEILAYKAVMDITIQHLMTRVKIVPISS